VTPQQAERSLEALVGDLAGLEKIIEGWDDPSHRQTVQALRTTLEQIQAGAFRRLIKTVKESGPEGFEALKAAVGDPWVFNVLTYHGILRAPSPSIEDRVRKALDEVRPTLASHEGDCELVAVEPPEVKIRLLGSCDGCISSADTVRLGIEKAVVDAVPEIERITVVANANALVQIGRGKDQGPAESPFARPYVDAAALEAVPVGDVLAVELDEVSVLLTRTRGGEVRAYPNACTHLGMPLDDGELKDGVLTCRYHGFRYLLASGECLTAPDIQLPVYPTEIADGRVRVQVPA
jgi:nitrite reductase/ring-hydroxylating ferredoxin subunit/Fe-S cluster biogenesis protein NfuA